MKLTLGFSPCPNDTFIFDALVNKKIDTGGIDFEVVLADVQTLNEMALLGRLDITKISYAVLPLLTDKYRVLNRGSALGTGAGPLLIAKDEQTKYDVQNKQIAIPGKNTTAHLLFSLAYPDAKNKVFLRYDEVEKFTVAGNGLGVIIHENRFTYAAKGLHKVIDLGDYWEQQTGHPIPLGGIVINRKIDTHTQRKVDALILKSIDHSFLHYPELSDYIKLHAQEMDKIIMQQHISLYVNEYSRNLNTKGKAAICKLLQVYETINNSVVNADDLFVD